MMTFIGSSKESIKKVLWEPKNILFEKYCLNLIVFYLYSCFKLISKQVLLFTSIKMIRQQEKIV